MLYLFCLLAVIGLFALAMAVYRCFNQGLSRSARWQQTTRFGVAAVLAVAPVACVGSFVSTAAFWLMAALSLLTMLTYPALAYATYRKSVAEIDNYMDIAVGMYVFGCLASVYFVLCIAGAGALAIALLSAVEVAIVLAAVFQIGYYVMYGVCIDDSGMKLILDTDTNEVIEFARSYGTARLVGMISVILCVCGAVIALNLCSSSPELSLSLPWLVCLLLVVVAAVTLYELFKPRKGAVWRSGLGKLWLDTAEYARSLRDYAVHREARLKALEIRPKVSGNTPSTVIMVIGESASRDYMSAFTSMECDTTPWLNGASSDLSHFFLFPNAYSCSHQTVPVLEQALTEKNQYATLSFFDSCTVVDIARALGYKTYWFSNQGHVGAADTAVTLVAETSDCARWTAQEVGKPHYDGALLDFLEQVNPSDRNFIVLHLMGSHFNYINRYPPQERTFSPEDGVMDNILNYYDSLRYTDTVLRQVHEYARENLGLDAMVYFSDHAVFPDKQRSPRFEGQGQCRIPMFVWLSRGYISEHPDVAAALAANRDRYFTNDLVYELMCGIFDIESNRYDPEMSIASALYKPTKDTLRTFLGTAPLQ